MNKKKVTIKKRHVKNNERKEDCNEREENKVKGLVPYKVIPLAVPVIRIFRGRGQVKKIHVITEPFTA